MIRLAVGLVAVLVMAVTIGRAIGRTEDELFQSRDYGSYMPEETLIDTDEDGKTADLALTSGASSQLGQTTTQSVLEWSSDFVQGTCPNGNPGFQGRFVSGSAVIHTAKGDRLLIHFDRGTTCIGSTTNAASISLEGTIIGGTGRFIDAKGTVQVNGIAILEVVSNESGVILFDSMDSQTTGTIRTQNHGRG